jgi:hypothetical protein
MLSPLGFDTDVITDEAAIDAFAATDTLCTLTVGATCAAVVVAVRELYADHVPVVAS